MEPLKVYTAVASPQVRKPTLRDRLLYSHWYLEARVVADAFAAHMAALVERLDELVSTPREGGTR